jgi:hypothetical protein
VDVEQILLEVHIGEVQGESLATSQSGRVQQLAHHGQAVGAGGWLDVFA